MGLQVISKKKGEIEEQLIRRQSQGKLELYDERIDELIKARPGRSLPVREGSLSAPNDPGSERELKIWPEPKQKTPFMSKSEELTQQVLQKEPEWAKGADPKVARSFHSLDLSRRDKPPSSGVNEDLFKIMIAQAKANEEGISRQP